MEGQETYYVRISRVAKRIINLGLDHKNSKDEARIRLLLSKLGISDDPNTLRFVFCITEEMRCNSSWTTFLYG